ncbi:hypothetical protein H1230_16420 [Paenibacillus sp. 19GGS1-52]|uniref:hypothetical protein n=1 Tax=Paenibacillus sp. 19GGS1-52 TaxID=2758563 RepID=UPI001EFB0BDE|nr:hypothetical protein [Paenibacillus sp. 19GGS1-52]ULO04748.1 hypothetical protein H1230_16420 [Paenibacillus sp. 19GGS1-52]
MNVLKFIGGIDLHDSTVELVSYDESSKVLSITIDLCHWRQPSYNEQTDPETIIKTLKFTGVSQYISSRNTLTFDSNDILDVNFIPATDGEQVEFILNSDDDIITLTIKAEHVEWINS